MSAEWGLAHVGISCSAALGDLDRDGDLDVVVANLDEPISVYRNHSAQGNRVLIELRGAPGNRYGVGAIGASRDVATACRFGSRFPPPGISHRTIRSSISDSETRRKSSVSRSTGPAVIARSFTISQPIASTRSTSVPTRNPRNRVAPPPGSKPCRSSTMRGTWKPDSMIFGGNLCCPIDCRSSDLGLPVVTSTATVTTMSIWAEQPDRAASCIFNTTRGQFVSADTYPFNQAAACEDMGAVMLDVDGDRDLDLYVVSGSVECEAGASELADRLYLNQGNGHFRLAADGALPKCFDSGSTVTAADFDRDGDLDLFIGGRVIPGRYPETPNSRLLRNDAGRFVDVTTNIAPGLQGTGLVTASIWSDVDRDGWLDLLITHEWGPVKLFRNRQGQLEDQTDHTGTQHLSGWWNGIAGRDLDGDGDIDYVVTNFGLNTKYHATAEKPTLLYYGDFDGTGNMNLIEAEFEDESLFPVRGRSCSSNAIPSLRQKFDSYKSFALAELDEIYETQRLENAHRFAATTLESGVLINDGSGRFEFRPLPRLAQVAPSFGVVLTELDGDGHCDLFWHRTSIRRKSKQAGWTAASACC